MEIAKRGVDAFNRGDMEAVRETLDPDVAFGRELEGFPEPGPIVGRDAVMRQWERVREPFGDAATLELVSIIDAGDRVVARQIAHAVGRGPAIHHEFTTVGTFRSGRIVLVDYFWDYAEALEAVGLSEQDVQADS